MQQTVFGVVLLVGLSGIGVIELFGDQPSRVVVFVPGLRVDGAHVVGLANQEPSIVVKESDSKTATLPAAIFPVLVELAVLSVGPAFFLVHLAIIVPIDVRSDKAV